MALFLSEAVNNYERRQVTRGSTNLTEAALMLLNISEQSAALTEAVMTAEFTLMRQCRNLSEGETSNKMKDFGKKVWHNLKAFAKTVWAKIKEICRMVWRKLKEWGANILDMFSGKEMEIPKRDLKYLEEAPRLIERLLFIAEKGITASEDAADDIRDKAKEVKKDFEELKKAAKKEEKFHESYYGRSGRSLNEGLKDYDEDEEFFDLLFKPTENMTEEDLNRFSKLHNDLIAPDKGFGAGKRGQIDEEYSDLTLTRAAEKVKKVKAELQNRKNTASQQSQGNTQSTTNNKTLREKGLVKVGKNWLKSIQSTLTGYASKLEKLVEKMDKKVEDIDRLESRMSHEDNQKDIGKASSKLKSAIEILKDVSSELITLTNKITQIGRSVGKNESSSSGLAKYLKDKFNIDEGALKSALQRNDVSAIIHAIEASKEKDNEKDKAKDRVNTALERAKHFSGSDYDR